MSSIATVVEYKNNFWAITKVDGSRLPTNVIYAPSEEIAEFFVLSLAAQTKAVVIPRSRNFISVLRVEGSIGTNFHVAEGCIKGRIRLHGGFTTKRMAEEEAEKAAKMSGIIYVPNYYKNDPLRQFQTLPLQQSSLAQLYKDRVAYSWKG
ncbi:MAG: hypothetical protein ChlgKO_08730 [Chlamydiales bacterium]